jgi:hypothetical protein
MKKVFLTSIFCTMLMTGVVSALHADQADPSAAWRNYYFELSFGNSILFLDQGYTNSSSGAVSHSTLPVSSYLFTLEWRATEKISIAGAWNLPFTTVKRVSGSGISEKYVAPSYGAGITFIPHSFKVSETTVIEPEIAVLLFRTYKSTSSGGDFFFPAGVFKLNVARDSGMDIFIGVTQAPAKNTTALLYGIGQRF